MLEEDVEVGIAVAVEVIATAHAAVAAIVITVDAGEGRPLGEWCTPALEVLNATVVLVHAAAGLVGAKRSWCRNLETALLRAAAVATVTVTDMGS